MLLMVNNIKKQLHCCKYWFLVCPVIFAADNAMKYKKYKNLSDHDIMHTLPHVCRERLSFVDKSVFFSLSILLSHATEAEETEAAGVKPTEGQRGEKEPLGRKGSQR